ncbi:Exopolysaccharide biosynthesis protein, glycosyltransferase [Sphingobium yanoikuyae]|uniref:Exopolysaccharide biosynthesis protein, glycosyltransferase n=1 Tax=Sphingobium yanoikuyae TaxID=13690 RepID=A0A084EBD2_SPHYA|nr:Exopolysaccharide biosynthesis protein, glycosyltransferase [Sphingobium yanoikuyae]
MTEKRLRICLAASGGGHLRQIIDLKPLWHDFDHFLVTEDTALGRTLAETLDVAFVRHVALGQARLGATMTMICAGIINFFQSAGIILKRRPHVVLSTGAGAMFFGIAFARLLGAKVIIIDSMARVRHPSIFARVTGLLAHVRIAQSEAAAKQWRGSLPYDSLKLLFDPPPPKEPLLFATVGATLSFDRLIDMVETAKRNGVLPERVIAQCGEGGKQSDLFETVESLHFNELEEILRRADFVVCHGGTGSLVTALQNGCRTIVIPRRFDRGEHYDDHQEEIAQSFHDRGLAIMVDTQDEFDAAIAQWRARAPVVGTRDASDMVAHLRGHMEKWANR